MMKKDTINSLADHYKITICGATETGKKHIVEKEKNQDAIKIKRYSFGCIISLADGVGSHKYSRRGSRSIVQSVHRTIIDLVKGKIKKNDFAYSVNKYFSQSFPKEYLSQAGTTCIFAAYIYKKGLFLGQIGDGICVFSVDHNKSILITKEDDFSNTVTPFIGELSDNTWKLMCIPEENIRNELDVLLLTDGLSEDIVHGKEFEFMKTIKNLMAGKTDAKATDVLRGIIKTWPVPMSSDDKSACFLNITKRVKTGEVR